MVYRVIVKRGQLTKKENCFFPDRFSIFSQLNSRYSPLMQILYKLPIKTKARFVLFILFNLIEYMNKKRFALQ